MKLEDLKGVGPKKLDLLHKLDIYTIDDLLEYFPFRYENRKDLIKLSEIQHNQQALTKIEITSELDTRYIRRGMNITKAEGTDGFRRLTIVWFNTPYIKNTIKKNKSYYVYGLFKTNQHGLEIQNPIIEETLGKDLGYIYPIYPTTKGITNKDWIKFISQAFKIKKNQIKNLLPDHHMEIFEMIPKSDAIRQLHFPASTKKYRIAKNTILFEEAILMELTLQSFQSTKLENGIRFIKDKRVDEFINGLPFELTDAQQRVYKELLEDMSRPIQMNRLIQGDVGSGKTILSILAMLNAYYNGYQSVFMAPTEILATQHYHTFQKLLTKNDVKIGLLKSNLKTSEKDSLILQIRRGEIDMLITTHAVLEERAQFDRLGLVVTDEQHRFGVKQRAIISSKGEQPDTLVMSATPIPRTMALTFFADLDISIVDELPPGRIPIDTIVVDSSYEERMIKFLIKQIDQGRQVYIVTPLIEESDKLDLNSVVKLYERLKATYFKSVETAFLHGKMKSVEKECIMNNFVANNIKILFSTTVIEVGVDVPNANIMVIYNAERFGLAQLHQLRGRVGRGKHASYCILINMSQSAISNRRMRIMKNTQNGFEIARQDLELRGYGDVFGTRQSGMPLFKLLDPIRDVNILEKVNPFVKEVNRKGLLKLKEYSALLEAVGKNKNRLKRRIILN